MTDQASIDLLRRLCLAAGPPGAEDEVRRLVRAELADSGELRHDRLGSLLCEKRGAADSPRIVLDSHLDEVGFMVQSVTDEGRLRFVALGSWWEHVLLGQRVEVLAGGGRLPGVIGAKPPHFLTPQERKQLVDLESMYVDVGASSRAQIDALGVRPGDPIVPAGEFVELRVEGVLGCKAMDDRVGVCLMVETLQALRHAQHPNTVVGVGAVQEELGARGGGTAAELARPDVAIVLECTPADDLPGFETRQGVLGGGPQIRHFDPTALSNRALVALVEGLARELGIPHQMAVRRTGGTDAQRIHVAQAGVPTVVIGVPARYIHTHFALLQWRDYVAARRLTVELVRRLAREQVAALTRFD